MAATQGETLDIAARFYNMGTGSKNRIAVGLYDTSVSPEVAIDLAETCFSGLPNSSGICRESEHRGCYLSSWIRCLLKHYQEAWFYPPDRKEIAGMNKVILLFLVTGFAYATDVVWEFLLPGYSFQDIRQTADGGFAVAGSYSSGRGYDAGMFRFDQAGSLLWSVCVGDPPCTNGNAECIRELPGGGFIVTGYLMRGSPSTKCLFLAKISDGGDLIWRSDRISQDSETGFSVATLPAGGYVVMGARSWAVEQGVFLLALYDELGEEIFSNEWGNANTTSLGSTGYIDAVSNDHILVSGSAYPDDWPPHPIMACFSIDGGLLWYRHYEQYGLWGREAYIRPDGKCWFGTSSYALLIDTIQGTVLKSIPLDYNYRTEETYSCFMTSDGGLVTSGACDYLGPVSTLTEETWDGWIQKFSDQGLLEWTEHYENTSQNQWLHSVRQLNTGGYIAAGDCIPGGGWLIRLEPEEGINLEDTSSKFIVSVQPNPSPSVCSISLQIPETGRVTVGLYDISGHCIDSWSGEMERGFGSQSFSDLRTGVYVLHAAMGNAISSVLFTVITSAD